MSGDGSAERGFELERFTEELANQLTHGLGVALSLVGAVALMTAVTRHGTPWQIAGCAIYSATLVALYTASTLSHSFTSPSWRHCFRTLDQTCIFLLIAGTFTPFGLNYLRGPLGWALFIGIWILAFAGIGLKLFRAKLENVSVSIYVMLGWLPIIAIKPIVEIVPRGALILLILGGLCYTVGTQFLMRDERVPYFHAVWHVLVVAGSTFHFAAVMLYVVPWT